MASQFIRIGAETHAIFDGLKANIRRAEPVMTGATTLAAIVRADESLKAARTQIDTMRLALRKEMAAQRKQAREDGVRRTA